MTADNKAHVTWNEKEKRYELHIDGVLKAYSVASEGAEDTQDGHKVGYDDLCAIARENRYGVVTEAYKGDIEKEGVE